MIALGMPNQRQQGVAEVFPGEAEVGDCQFKATQDNTERSSLKLSVKEEPGLRLGGYCVCLACARSWV